MELFKLLGKIALEGVDDVNDGIDKVTNKASKVNEGFQKVGTAVKNAGEKLTSTGKTLTAAITVPVAGAVAGLTTFATKTAAVADNVDKMSQKIGISRKAYQELDFICSQTGTSVDNLQMGMKTLTSKMDGARDGTKSAVEIFDKLKVSVTNADGSFRKQEDVLFDTMKALQGMEDQTEKARLATELFGRSGSELMPLLNGEAGSIEEMVKQANDLGLVLSDEAIDSGVKFTDTVDQMKRAFSAATTELGAQLLPTMTDLVNVIIEKGIPAFKEFIGKISDAIEWFKNLDDNTKKTIEIISGIAVAIGPVLIVLGKLTSALGSIINLMGTLVPVIGGITAPILVVVAVIAVLVAAFVHLWKTNEDFRNNITAIWERLKTTFEEFGQGIVDRLNDMGFQFENISEVIRAAWEGLCNFLAPIFEGAFGQIVNAFSFALNTILNYFDLFKAVFTGDWQGAFDAVKNIVTTALDFIKNTFQTWFNAFDSLTNGKLTAFKDKVVNIFETVKQKIGSALDWIKSRFESLQLKFPNIKLPHFSIQGEWSFNPPSVPHFAVDWYAKAMDNPMIMNSPTAFGINANGQVMAGGEAGSEVVSGTNTLMNMISSSVSAQNKVLEDKLQSILSMMAEYMPQMANMQMVIDSGALVGQIAPSMDVALGTMQIRAGRGAI